MPPAILNDSDDEDGDIVLPEVDDRSTARSSGKQDPVPNLDASNDRSSTGSTIRLKRQLDDAERNLFVDSGEQSLSSNGNQPAQAASTSPLLPRTKRRHTEITANPSVSADATVKRTKTVKTYSTNKPTSIAAEKQRFFEDFREDGPDPKTSQSASFSEYSRGSRSSGLPGGTMQANFVDHEPAVMFKDSGSTVPDNDSSHERMVERALQSKANDRTSILKLNDVDAMQQKSSSFPWSASEQTDATKTPVSKETAEVAAEPDKPDLSAEQAQGNSKDGAQREDEIEVAALPSSKESEPAHGSYVHSQETGKRYASPMVQVDLNEVGAATSVGQQPEPAKATQEATRGRKRKIQEEFSEPLNSDEIAVGLPREHYKPRPSKRRSTQVAKEPVDYSIAPEKAARSKRSKTTGASQHEPKEIADVTFDKATQDTKSTAKGRKPKRVAPATAKAASEDEIKCICGSDEDHGNTVACDTCNTWQHIACYYPESGNKLPKNMRHDCVTCQSGHRSEQKDDLPAAKDAETQGVATVEPTQNEKAEVSRLKPAPVGTEPRSAQELNELLSQNPATRSFQRGSKAKTEDAVFKKPASKLKPVSKSKRSHTTIFEDHVEIAGMQSSPSLRQQQAARKSALKDVKNEAVPPSKSRNRARVPQDSEEDQDELAFDPGQDDEGEDAPPKKHGKGRLPKAAPKAAAKSAEKVVDGSDEDEAEDEVPVEQPKKRGSGRPRKAQPTDTDEATASAEPDGTKAQPTIEKAAEESLGPDAPSKQSTATNMPTPSPDKPTPGTDVATPQEKVKGSPTNHSAIQNSSAVPLRVGLSKRQRIPPLLRMMKPPPKRIEKK